jgi:hypothetical protein
MNIIQLLLLFLMLLLSAYVFFRGIRMMYFASKENIKGLLIGITLILGGGFFVVWLAMLLYEEIIP